MTALLDTLAIWSVPVAVLGLMVGAYWMGRETAKDARERFRDDQWPKDAMQRAADENLRAFKGYNRIPKALRNPPAGE